MRHALVPALLVLALLAASAVGGVVLASATGSGEELAVEGTVTGPGQAPVPGFGLGGAVATAAVLLVLVVARTVRR
jgi:UPF0716 family protein affecting phage T7 exclusion